MANERSAAEAAPKSGDKPAAHRSRHRSGRSGRSGGSSAAAPAARAASAKGSPRWTWRDYVLQFSVVILGVMVTFVGSGMIERARDRREVHTVMQLVCEELKSNRDDVEAICRRLSMERDGIRLVRDSGLDYRRLPADLLRKYQFILGSLRTFVPRVDALEVLRTSGTITSVDDKTLLFEVLECYTRLNSLSSSIDTYNDQKIQSLNHLFSNGGRMDADMNPSEYWQLLLNDPRCAAFFGAMTNYFGDRLLGGGAVADVERVIDKLNEKYRFERPGAQK